MRLHYANSLWLAVALLPAVGGMGQQPGQQPHRHPMGPPPYGRGPGGLPPGGRPNNMRGKFPAFFDQLAKMPAEDREKALAADPHFQRMPPERQAQVRENLERFANMTPEQKQLFRDRFGIVNSMPPENRDRIREVFPRWKQLPEDRRQAMREELRVLTAMSPEDREKHFADPDFQNKYSSKEQRLLKDLAGLVR